MLILGLNMHHADASAALVADGEVTFAVAEERLNRVKHYGGVPVRAIRACLDAAGVGISEIDHVAVGRDPRANRAPKLRYALAHPGRLRNLLRVRRRGTAASDLRGVLARELEVDPTRLRFREHHVEHHLAHIASAYYCSPWESAAGFSCDGSGDFVTTMLARGQGPRLDVLERVFVPHSLGSFYTMVCDFIGYRRYGDEGKVMGLAAYGKESFRDTLASVVRPKGDGFELALEYFLPLGSTAGMRIGADGTAHLARHWSRKMIEVFGEPREPGGPITQREMDLAWALQERFEQVYFHALRSLHQRTGLDDVAMAGGCALNSVANGKLFAETPFRRTWIQPAAGDEGLALGSALYVYHAVLGGTRRHALTHAYLGPEFSEPRMRAALDGAGVRYARFGREPLLEAVAGRIAGGQVVGWFQGRMEWGPRALGNRSILAHPGLASMKDTLNARIKQREWFRPFAPSVLAERQPEYFTHDHPSPFMLHVYPIRPDKRERLAAVNHVDDTGRLQSVARDENPLYYDLIGAFERRTGTPVVLNTSFNENEPIVCTPEDAIECFRRTRMDALAIGPFVAAKQEA
jgi:carbamoyltransferase